MTLVWLFKGDVFAEESLNNDNNLSEFGVECNSIKGKVWKINAAQFKFHF